MSLRVHKEVCKYEFYWNNQLRIKQFLHISWDDYFGPIGTTRPPPRILLTSRESRQFLWPSLIFASQQTDKQLLGVQLTFENNKFHFATIQTPGPRLKLDHNSEHRNWSEFFHTFAAFTPENFIRSIFGSIAFLKKSQADHALRWPLRSKRAN